jgi:hypothetical protein
MEEPLRAPLQILPGENEKNNAVSAGIGHRVLCTGLNPDFSRIQISPATTELHYSMYKGGS